MTIDFHCEHCNQMVTAPPDAAGRRGKCPHCSQKVYIPMQEDEGRGELPLVPLDPQEEEHRRKVAREAAAYQMELLREKTAPGDLKKPDRSGLGRLGGPAAKAALSSKKLNRLIVRYVESMAGGQLDQAGELLTQLSPHRKQTIDVLDGMATEDLAGYGLPPLPRPVLLGFLKQLRTKL